MKNIYIILQNIITLYFYLLKTLTYQRRCMILDLLIDDIRAHYASKELIGSRHYLVLRYGYPGIKHIVHGRRDRILTEFENVLTQYEPMISASIRKLNIYRDHESFRQAGRVALWQAWTRYEEGRGHFAPYASRSIRGAMLDRLKGEIRFEENVMQTEDDVLEILSKLEGPASEKWSDRLATAFETLTEEERSLIHWLFVDGLTQAECAVKVNISVAGIKKRRERMLVKLRKALM